MIGGRGRWTEDALPPALLFIAFASVALCMPPHNDTWWHLRSGLEMVKTGSILTTEQLSHTVQGAPLYHNHEWLTQLIFHCLYNVGGPLLLAFVCATLAMSATAGAWRLVEGSADARFVGLGLLLAGTVMAWAIRPQVVSLLFFVVAIHLVTSDRDRWLPLLCAVWANFHAVAVTGVVIAGCAALDSAVWARHRARRSIWIFVACALAPMITPLGWHYWPRALQVVRLARALNIDEYRSAFTMSMLLFWTCVLAFVALAARSGALPWQSRRTRILVLLASVFGIAGALSVRNIPLFMLVAIPAISRLWPSRDSRRLAPGPLPAASVALIVVAAMTAAAGTVFAWRDGGAHLGWAPMTPSAVAAIRRCEGRVFNGFADGGPLTWFVPDRKVFVDSRGVEAYPLELLLRSRDADMRGKYRELFDEYDIGCAVVQAGSVMARTLATDPQMRQVYADASWRVFSRQRP